MSGMRGFSALLLTAIGAAVLGGCISSSSPVQWNYYTLPTGSNAELIGTAPRVMTGPVSLPRYLDRPQLVTRSADGRILLREQDRWAEPLGALTTSRLTYGLRNELQSAGVVPFPVAGFTQFDYRLTVEVSRFEATTADTVVLEAAWGVSDNDGDLLAGPRFSSYSRPASAGNIKAVVAAMADMLDELAAEAAAVIRELQAAG